MKKSRKILSAITAVAVAAAGIIVPTENNLNKNGFNIETDAVYVDHTYNDYHDGGLELVYLVNGKTPDPAYDLETLGEGDKVRLTLVVPDLTDQLDALQAEGAGTAYEDYDVQRYWNESLNPPDYTDILGADRGLDTAKFTIKYNANVFKLTKWYNNEIDPDENTIDWDYIGDILHGSNTQTYNSVDANGEGTLYVNATTNGVNKVNGRFFGAADAAGNPLYIQAEFEVISGVPAAGVKFWLVDDNEDDIDFNVLDKNGQNPLQIWKPDEDQKEVTVNVTNYLELYVDGNVDEDIDVHMYATYLNDKSQVKPGKVVPLPEILTTMDIKIGDTKKACDIYIDPNTQDKYYKSGENYYDINGNIANAPADVKKVTIYKFKGIDYPAAPYYTTICYKFYINRWCTYNNYLKPSNGDWQDNPMDDGYNIKIEYDFNTLEYKVAKYSTEKPIPIKVRLYGDVDGEDGVNVRDATMILKHKVGKKNTNTGNDYIDDGTAGDKLNNFRYANVLTAAIGAVSDVDDNLNTRDATQILRYITDQPSIFTTKLQEVEARIAEWDAKVNPAP